MKSLTSMKLIAIALLLTLTSCVREPAPGQVWVFVDHDPFGQHVATNHVIAVKSGYVQFWWHSAISGNPLTSSLPVEVFACMERVK
jgi:hypothetical protein